MTKYVVTWNELYTCSATVEAINEDEARQIVMVYPVDEHKEFTEYVDGSWYIIEHPDPDSVHNAYNPLEEALIDLNDPREAAMNAWDGESDPPVI